MPANRKDFSAEIALYLSGKSLEEVAKEIGVTRQAVFKAFKRRGVQMREKSPIGEGGTFFVHGDGYGHEKQAAKTEVMKAIRAGRLVRMPCEKCGCSPGPINGRSPVHAHHADYKKPLEVVWLCLPCHYAEHHQ